MIRIQRRNTAVSSLEMSVGIEMGSETLLNPVQMHSTAIDTSGAPAAKPPKILI